MNLVFAVLCCAAVQNNDPFESRQPQHREHLLKSGGGSKETEAAVRKAIDWLVRNQKPDGSWDAPEADCRVGVTGLAVLAFLGAGHSPESKEHGASIRKAFQFLRSVQDAEGCVGARGEKYLYGHAIATAAFAEALAMSGVKDYEPPGQRCVDFLVASQNLGKGWRYSARCGDNDSLVTGWAILALRSAEQAELRFNKAAYDGARAFFDSVANDDGRFGYHSRVSDDHGLRAVAIEPFESHPTSTAASILGIYLMTKRKMDPQVPRALEVLLKDKPRRDKNAVDFYYWHFASLAVHSLDDPGKEQWKSWNKPLTEALIGTQVAQGEAEGSWDLLDYWSKSGGRVYATAINALTLETYYRYVKFFRGQEK
jgi:hypothetical protein